MIIFPAVDIKGGKAVRLRKGDKNAVTTFADDPLELAKRWADQGAEWIHIVDLDGAFEGSTANMEAVGRITAQAGLPCQVGGGIRSLETAQKYLDAGADRLIIGTVALEDPGLFSEICKEFPGKVGVSLDAENGRLKSRGWAADTGKTILEALPELACAAFLIYTDIERDGMKTGVNLTALADLLAATEQPVIAAGGVSSLQDVKSIHKLSGLGNLEGVISGRAICDGGLDLGEAIAWLKARS